MLRPPCSTSADPRGRLLPLSHSLSHATAGTGNCPAPAFQTTWDSSGLGCQETPAGKGAFTFFFLHNCV